MFVFYHHTLLVCLFRVTYYGMQLCPRNVLLKKKKPKIEELNNWQYDKASTLSLLQDKRLLLGKKKQVLVPSCQRNPVVSAS